MNFQKTHQSSSVLCHKPAANSQLKINSRFFILSLFILSLILFLPTLAFAKEDKAKSLDDILNLKAAPAGVVIEIVTWGGDNLEWALPRSKEYIEKLRAKFPKLSVAIVTHGAEQFALTNDNKEDSKEVHKMVKSFGDANVPVHVCETFAGWRGLSSDDFPEYVNVAAAGPAQVNDYLSLGYELILIDEE